MQFSDVGAIVDKYPERVLSVTEATGRGVAGLVKDAERKDIIVQRHGHAVAAVISVKHLAELNTLRPDLTAAALVLARELADSGERTGPGRRHQGVRFRSGRA